MEKGCSMIDKFVFAAVVWLLPFSSLCQAQSVRSLIPWAEFPQEVEIGMSVENLVAYVPGLAQMSQYMDAEPDPNDDGTFPDGLCYDRDNKTYLQESVFYWIRDGRLTQVFWSSKNKASLPDVEGFRKQFLKNHGDPRLGYRARVTIEGIAKVTTEVFTVKNTDLVIALSSALGETEVAVLDTSDPEVDIEGLYFSFEERRQHLESELLRLSKEMPKDEPESEIHDTLKEAIERQSGKEEESRKDQGPRVDDAPDEGRSRPSANEGVTANSNQTEGSGFRFGHLVLVLAVPLLLAGIYVFVRRSKEVK